MLLLPPFYRRRNWCLEKLSDLSKATRPESGGFRASDPGCLPAESAITFYSLRKNFPPEGAEEQMGEESSSSGISEQMLKSGGRERRWEELCAWSCAGATTNIQTFLVTLTMPSSSTEAPLKMLLAKHSLSNPRPKTDGPVCSRHASRRGGRSSGVEAGPVLSLKPTAYQWANLGKSFHFSISPLKNRIGILIPVLLTLQGKYKDQTGSFTWKCFLNLKVLRTCEEHEAKVPLSNQFPCRVNITLRKLSPAPETLERHITFLLKERFDGSVKAVRFCHFLRPRYLHMICMCLHNRFKRLTESV